jgi:ATP-dependent Clp protease ATP-binding subunit ClpA
LQEGANAAIAALWYAGLSEALIHRLRFELEHSLGDPPGRIPPRQVTIDLTPGEEDVVRLADIEADRFNDPYLGAEHILLAILRSDKATAQRFAEHGVSPEQYEIGLTSVRRGDPPPDQPRAI